MKRLIAFVLVSLGIYFAFGLLGVQTSSPSPIIPMNSPSNLLIESLDISATIVFPESNSEEAIQNALHDGVAHYEGTALPGEFGNVYIVGHSSDYPWAQGDYKTIFAKLSDIKNGAEINIVFQNQEFVYKVVETKIVEADDLSVLDQPNDQKLLTLQTSYPVGTALQRLLVVAKLSN